MASSSGQKGVVSCRHHPDAPLIEDYRAGDMICSECGLVVGDRVVDVGSEWRTFSNEKATSDPSRVGSAQNPLLSGGDLSTLIEKPMPGNYEMDGFARNHNSRSGLSYLTTRRKKKQTRLPEQGIFYLKTRVQELIYRSGYPELISGADRSLLNAFREISIMADRINLPRKIVDRANQLFKQVHEQRSLKGRSNDAIASACLYIACRQEGVPRTLKEICAISKTSKKEIGRCFKLILKHLETSVDLITSGDFMSRFCSNLNLPTTVQRAATHIARKAVDLDLVPGRSPISIAAAAIYMASQASEEKRSQKEIGDIAGVADVTIRQSYRLLYPRARDLFPTDFNFVTPLERLPSS